MAIRKERIQVQVEIGTDEAKNQLNSLQTEAGKIRDRMSELKKGTKEYKEEAAKLKQVEADMAAVKKEIGLAALPLKDLQAESRKLRREINQLVPGTAEFINKAKQLQEVEGRIKEVRTGINGTTKATDAMSAGFRSAVMALGPLFAISEIFNQLVQLTQYVIGLDSAWLKLEGTIARSSGLQGEALTQAAGQVQALANTFELETNEIDRAANSLAKNMGISYKEALTLIEQGMLAGANKSGDFLDQLYEYAPQFKAAGIEAETMVAELVRAEKEGIFSDKGADVIKEFGLRIREQTKATKDAMIDAFGEKFTTELFRGINDGSISTAEALKRVSKEMNNTQIPANKLQTVIADVFGGPGEDAGLRYLQSLKDIGGGIETLIDTSNSLTQAQQNQLALEKELASIQQELAKELDGTSSLWQFITMNLEILGTKVLLEVVRGFNAAKNAIIDVYNNSIAFRALVQGIGLVFNNQIAVVKAYFGFVLDGYKMVGNAAAAVLKGEFASLPDIVREGGKEMNSNLTDLGKEIAQNFSDAYNEALNGQIAVDPPRPDIDAAKIAAAEQAKAEEAEKERIKLQMDKETREKLEKQRKEYEAKRLAAQRALQDLQIELMDEGTEKEIAKIRTKYEREIEEIGKGEVLAAERKKALRDLMQREIDEREAAAARQRQDYQIELMAEGEEKEIAKIRTKYEREIEAIAEGEILAAERKKALREEMQLAIDEAEEAARLGRRDKEMIALVEDQEIKKLLLEESFAKVLQTEEQQNQARYELERAALQARVQLLKKYHGEQSFEVLSANAQIIALDKQRQEEQLANEKKTNDLKDNLRKQSFDMALEFMNLGIQLLGQDEKARKKNAGAIKAFSVAEILTRLYMEISGYMAHPASTGTLGAIGTAKSIMATVRAFAAIANINSQKFARGGKIPRAQMGMVLDGPGHSQGGMPLLDPRSGQVVAELEGGEPVLSRLTYINNKPIIDKLLDASMNRNGASIMQQGGMVATAPPPNPSPIATAPQPTTAAPDSAVLEQNRLLRSILAEMIALNANFPLEIETYLVYNKFKKFTDRIEEDDAVSTL